MSLKSSVKVKIEYFGATYIFEFEKEFEKDRIIRYKLFQKELDNLKDKNEAEEVYRAFTFKTLKGARVLGSDGEGGAEITSEDIKNGNCYPEVIKAASEAYMYILRGAEAEVKKELIQD